MEAVNMPSYLVKLYAGEMKWILYVNTAGFCSDSPHGIFIGLQDTHFIITRAATIFLQDYQPEIFMSWVV